MEKDSLMRCTFLLHYGLNLESFYWAWESILQKITSAIVFLAKFTWESMVKSQIPAACNNAIAF